ncbi:conserved hypothetical protein; putative membrane protein; Putative ammonia monooxygenase [Pseudorhizobium banfieldiae]|uniref:Ammonia monooxygenase n=1 Tax=Pseudorhizobium banfieldiae TaxID=1125847 RepID=L0NDF3_9HYPH|nr:AbrB family transcriptional regulator [Pseudorhizobium banfieldiae]CAD6601992.1 monooxygenase [arsenite-oxidising bacterium NT-25]CCF18337.1 conserved hypothetical protein; putative membrane protein; Putative ammonia monooxygenase [Pseudorhizobium banfieldiae]
MILHPSGKRLVRKAVTLGIGLVGGLVALIVGAPLPWLIGAQLALCLVALSGIQILGGAPEWPQKSRSLFFPVLGVMIGAAFSADILREIPGWWPALIAVTLFLLVAQAVVYLLFRHVGGYDRATAFFSSFPGGFVEAAVLGREAGAIERLVTLQHFLRVSLIVLLMPLIFWALSGHRVGSAAGLPTSDVNLTLGSATLLVAAGLIGSFIGPWLRFPAPEVSGPLSVSAVFHSAGLIEGSIPPIMLSLTQLVIGTSLGVGFVGIAGREFMRGVGLALAAFALVLGLAACSAWLIAPALETPKEAIILAFVPGGLAEMSLIALTLNLSVPFVILIHFYRILFTLGVIPQLARRVIDRSGA